MRYFVRICVSLHDSIAYPNLSEGIELCIEAHPVKNMFPTLALAKLKTLEGLALFTISRLSRFRKLRMSSFFAKETLSHSSWRASTISSHSARASCGSDERR